MDTDFSLGWTNYPGCPFQCASFNSLKVYRNVGSGQEGWPPEFNFPSRVETKLHSLQTSMSTGSLVESTSYSRCTIPQESAKADMPHWESTFHAHDLFPSSHYPLPPRQTQHHVAYPRISLEVLRRSAYGYLFWPSTFDPCNNLIRGLTKRTLEPGHKAFKVKIGSLP